MTIPVSDGATASGYARRYGDAIRAVNAAEAERVVDEALAAGLTAAAVHTLVITPAMTRIGELWEAGAITVADEHAATAISHAVLVRLFALLRIAPPRSRERIVLAAVQGQHHVLGLRMVADVLEGAGFDVNYLGADVPAAELAYFVATREPAIAGLAFGIPTGIAVLAETIDAIHRSSPTTRVILGGHAIPDGLIDAGYPHVSDSMTALATVERALRSPSPPIPELLAFLIPKRHEPQRARETAFETHQDAERLAQIVQHATETARATARESPAINVARKPPHQP